MKHIFALMTCLLVGHLVFGQEPAYKWGEPATNNFPERTLDQLLVLDDLGFVLLRSHTDNTFTTHYWIEHYSPEMNFQTSFEVPFSPGVMGNSYSIDHLEVAGNQIYVFVGHWDKAAQKHSLSVKTLSLDGQLEDLADLGVIVAQKMGNRGQFYPKFSPDGTKLVVLEEMPFVKKTQEVVNVKCFNVSDMSLLWEHEETLPYPSKRAANNEHWVNNDGNVFFFKKFWEKPAWKYYTATVGGNGKWESHNAVDFTDHQVEDFAVKSDADGFYFFGSATRTPSAYKRDLHSYFHGRIGADLKPAFGYMEAWPKAMVSYFTGDRVPENPDKSRLENFYIKDVLTRTDGKHIVILEQARKDKSPIAGTSPIQYTYEWNYGDALAICIDPKDGAFAWWQTFKKAQEVKNNLEFDAYGSFVYHLKEDRLFLLYNATRLSIPSIPPAGWKEADGTKYVKNKAFDEKTAHATFMYVVEPNGDLTFGDRALGLPLLRMHEGAIFEMSMTTPFSFDYNGNLIVMASMHNGGKRYRFGIIGL